MLPERVARLFDVFFSAPGRLAPAQRRAAAAQAAATVGGPPPSEDVVPALLARWVDTVARHAPRCSDDDVAALRAGGVDEDTLYEATVAAAFGAARARLERALALVGGGRV